MIHLEPFWICSSNCCASFLHLYAPPPYQGGRGRLPRGYRMFQWGTVWIYSLWITNNNSHILISSFTSLETISNYLFIAQMPLPALTGPFNIMRYTILIRCYCKYNGLRQHTGVKFNLEKVLMWLAVSQLCFWYILLILPPPHMWTKVWDLILK